MEEKIVDSSSNERIQVLQTKYLHFLSDTLENFIDLLIDKKEEGWVRIRIDWTEDGTEIELSRYREETDKEYEKRMRLLEKQKKRDEKEKEERLKLYKKLRKEFDGNE